MRPSWAGQPGPAYRSPACRRPAACPGPRALRPVAAGAGGLHEDLPAVRRSERVELGLVVLRPGGDPAQPARTLLPSRARQSRCQSSRIPSRYPRCDTRFRDLFPDGLTWAGRCRRRRSRVTADPGTRPQRHRRLPRRPRPVRLRAPVGKRGQPAANRPAGEGGTHGRCTGDRRPGRRVPRRASAS